MNTKSLTANTPPEVECEKTHAGLAVADLAAAIDFYTNKLGFKLGFTWGDPPMMAGVNLGNTQLFLQSRTPSPEGARVYFVVGDVDSLHDYHVSNGVTISEPPGDREYGLRDYSIRDLNGYEIGFGQYIYTVGDPIPIERVGVSLRLEKRLAALVADLAVHKRMSLDSLFEETLLHTLDGVGPHTDGQLAYIQQLKKKHGIDYDSHGSYRFVESHSDAHG